MGREDWGKEAEAETLVAVGAEGEEEIVEEEIPARGDAWMCVW